MPFVQQPIAEGTEDKPVDGDREYDLRVHSFVEETSKQGNPMWHAMITIEGEQAPPVHEYFSMVQEADDADKRRLKARGLRRFLVAFNIPHEADGFDPEDCPGAAARLTLTKEPFNRNDPRSDLINRIRYPRLED